VQSRFSIKIVGASGQGINSIGEILAKSIKRSGFCVVAYREYPSLIKGGHASYQIDFSAKQISGSTKKIDLLLVLNRQRTNWHLDELKPGGIILHDIPGPRINTQEAEKMRSLKVKIAYIPAHEIATTNGGNLIMSNIVSLGYLWKLLKLEIGVIEAVVGEIFADKPKYLPTNIACLKAGATYETGRKPNWESRPSQPGEIDASENDLLHLNGEEMLLNYFELTPEAAHQDKLLINGNEAISLGAIAAGVRIHFAYPMTPSSSILTFLANTAEQTGMIVKQVEDEITASAMALGAMHAGTRALTATSGGGFDLMSEHISLSGILETPMVVILAQRPGPATGLPTWTAQGDLQLAICAAHGEFPRCVISCSDATNAYSLIQEAFNIAETYQIPVILLTDKLLAESAFTVSPLNHNLPINRGLVASGEKRYLLSEDGISPRWLPGSPSKTYNANSDEHDEVGNVTERADMSTAMMEKRMRKLTKLQGSLPKQKLYFNDVDLSSASKKISLIGWGSTLTTVLDVMEELAKKNIKVDYLDVTHLWPLPVKQIKQYIESASNLCIIEGNFTGQFEQIIRMETGLTIPHHIRRYDGRPFFVDELTAQISSIFDIK
jgi:2-oxoglutarate ferredoxin oxidoreductase subunit alpha